MAFKMRGFSPFTKNGDNEKSSSGAIEEIEGIKKSKSSHWEEIAELEGEIEGIHDNEYSYAEKEGDESAIKKYEKQMLNLKKEIENKGGKYTHIDMRNFG